MSYTHPAFCTVVVIFSGIFPSRCYITVEHTLRSAVFLHFYDYQVMSCTSINIKFIIFPDLHKLFTNVLLLLSYATLRIYRYSVITVVIRENLADCRMQNCINTIYSCLFKFLYSGFDRVKHSVTYFFVCTPRLLVSSFRLYLVLYTVGIFCFFFYSIRYNTRFRFAVYEFRVFYVCGDNRPR